MLFELKHYRISRHRGPMARREVFALFSSMISPGRFPGWWLDVEAGLTGAMWFSVAALEQPKLGKQNLVALI